MPTLQAACRPEEAQSLANEQMQAPPGRPHSRPLGLWIAAQAANLREDVPAEKVVAAGKVWCQLLAVLSLICTV